MSAKIEINKDACTGCKTCVNACFIDVMRWDETEKKPLAAYEADCVWCFTCEINCPAKCINVTPIMPKWAALPY